MARVSSYRGFGEREGRGEYNEVEYGCGRERHAIVADPRTGAIPYFRRADAMEQATINHLSTLELGELQQHDNMAVWPYGSICHMLLK